MKIKNFLILTVISCMFVTAMADNKLSNKELMHINDSICHEARMLYNAEKCSWNASDVCLAECKNVDKGNFLLTYQVNEDYYSTILINTDDWTCYFQYNWTQGQGSSDFKPRPVTDKEKEAYRQHMSFKNQIMQLNVIPTETAIGGMNMQVLNLNKDLTRVYFLQGAKDNFVIPFGNDFCFDFDGSGNLISQRKFHTSNMPVKWENGKQPVYICHSHSGALPITTTDICTFLLYGTDLYDMKRFAVFSTSIGVLEFDADKFSIKRLSNKQFYKKMNGKQK